ncbi:aspartyl-phosphate phosphatase Spo0E family protein [Neobacillus niacini]|uniref:aspartyl-phosphate phosphatase Spo0E family protein n=1 Tax=Neobacillus niacini TaxID=86668 RepID=UPI002FFF8EDC
MKNMVMMLKYVLDLEMSLEGYRQQMYDLAKNKGIGDPETIKINQELDRKIVLLQKILSEINSVSA